MAFSRHVISCVLATPAEPPRGADPRGQPPGPPQTHQPGCLPGVSTSDERESAESTASSRPATSKINETHCLVRVIAGEGSALANSRRRTDVTGADRYSRLARPGPAGPGRMGRAN